MSLSNEVSYETGSFSHPPPQPPQVFTARGFEAFFPHAGSLGCAVCFTPPPSCSTGFICMRRWDHLFHQLPPCPASSLPWLPISAPPPGLNECFFFNCLVVGLPHSSIFWQFWLFFVFKFVVVVLLVVQGGTVFQPTPPFWGEGLLVKSWKLTCDRWLSADPECAVFPPRQRSRGLPGTSIQ